MDEDALYELWNEWLSTILTDVRGLLINRHIFQEVQRIIRSNAKIQLESSFYEWMGNVYATAAVIGVRRQLDMDKDSISFARLLTDIIANPQVLSKDRFVALYEGSNIPDHYAHRHFDGLFIPGFYHVNPSFVMHHLSALKHRAQPIRKYANKRIAHFDKSEFRELPTYAELDNCLNYLEELLKKYLLLFRAEGHQRIVPTWQYDWRQIFRFPWIEEESID